MPRKKSQEFYRTYGFTASYVRGKYTATCNFCNRVLQNTALSRLSLHRTTCDQQRSKCAVPYTHTNNVKQELAERHHIKIQQISGEDEDGLGYDTEGKEIIVKIQQILDAADEDKNANKTRKPVLVKSETRISDNPDHGAEHHMEFEISNAEFVDDSKEQQLDYSANGPAPTFVETRPRNNLAALKAEKTRAEIKQYRSKTKFLRTETENLKLERTLALLRIQKLRLEIDALRA